MVKDKFVRRCPVCDKVFYAKYPSSKYCCDECRKIGYQRNRDKFKEKNPDYYKNYHKKYDKRYCSENKEKRQEYNRGYYEENREKILKRRHEYYKKYKR